MLHIVLFEPEIPPNTGNAIRLTANCGAKLHLIEPLGFDFSDKQLRRAGMDYSDIAPVEIHKDWQHFKDHVESNYSKFRYITLSTKHQILYSDFEFNGENDFVIFGSESKGLPDEIRDCPDEEARLTLPMKENNRSLNLSNTIAIVAYEAWRQQGFN